MEKETEAGSSLNVSETRIKNQVMIPSVTRNPDLYRYVRIAERHIKDYNEVELSGIGMAIGTVVTVSEILKNKGLAVEKSHEMSSVEATNEKGQPTRKSKMEIILRKSEKFDEIVTTAAAEKTQAADECNFGLE